MTTPNFKFALREDLRDMKNFLPTRATPGSAGWDVSCAWESHQARLVVPGEYLMVPLGFRCIIPPGWWLELKSRSSSFIKKKLHALYGTIDCDYRGYMYYCCKYDGTEFLPLEFGEKIGQIIPVKLRDMTVEEIDNGTFEFLVSEEQTNARKAGGFGSTS